MDTKATWETARVEIAKSVRKALDEYAAGDIESAMVHACNAVDGTARNTYGYQLGNRDRFTRMLRDNYLILGPMSGGGFDLLAQRFPGFIEKGTTPDKEPDLADLIYTIHRCAHAHGDQIPFGYELLPVAGLGPRLTHMRVGYDWIQLSARIVPALAAVAVFAPVNATLSVDGDYWLSYSLTKMPLQDWWGEADKFPAIVATDPPPCITYKFEGKGAQSVNATAARDAIARTAGSEAPPADDVSGVSEPAYGPALATTLFEAGLPRGIWHRHISKADHPPANPIGHYSRPSHSLKSEDP